MGPREVEAGAFGYDAGRINRRMAVVVVPLNVVEVDSLRDTRVLVKVAQVIRQIGEIHEKIVS